MNPHSTPPRSASGDLSSLFVEAAVRESYRPQDLLDRWLQQFPNATPDEQLVAVTDALELKALGRPMADSRGEDALGLPNEVRFKMLAGMGAKEALTAVKAIPFDERTSVENDFERLLKHRIASFDSQSRDEITSMMAANHWAMAAGIKSLLSQDELAVTLRKLDFLQNLGGEDLNRFVGRATELQKLHTLWHKQGQHRTTIHVEGPGGMGKSLLVCRFIGDLLAPHHEANVPDAVFHIDFDRQAFHQARPTTIIQEFIVQSRYWLGKVQDDAYRELLEGVRVAAGDIEFGSANLNVADSGRARYFASQLVEQFRRPDRSPPRFIIFVDSFEQVLGFDDTAADSCARATDLMEASGAAIMIVYASRTFSGRDETQASNSINLNGLNALEADQYLKSRIEELGLSVSNTILRQVRQAVGSTPLALRLAASLIEHDPSVRAVREWATTARTSSVLRQAMLYERLLKRIRNKQLRKIAMPGLLVRRITPDVIEQVLAEPCNLVLSTTTPSQLMTAARKEGQLFFEKSSDPGALWHRQDVRATMLRNLDRDISDQTYIAINKRAIAFYEKQRGVSARIEELYHRLRLNQSEGILRERWLEQAEPELRRVREEFPDEAQAFLRVHSSSALRESLRSSAVLAGVDNKNFERDQQELRILASKQLQSDTDVHGLMLHLEQAGVDITGALGDLYAQGLFATGRHTQLLTGARKLLHKRPGNNAAVRCTIYITAAQLLEGRGEWPEAHQFWVAARSVSRKVEELTELQCVIGVLRITRKLRINRVTDNYRLVTTALDLLSKNVKAIYSRPILSREVCAELLGNASKLPARPLGFTYDVVRKLTERMLSRGEAFPSTLDHRDRLDRINDILHLPRSVSKRELRNASAKLFADGVNTIALTNALRDEIDWNMTKSLETATQ